MKTQPGLVLADRYELTSLIATGGMGQVWRGMDRELDREVAIKVLREEYAGDEAFLKRFRAEARHTAALSHDAIAGLYDYGELDGRAYIVMELCPGRPLSDIIDEHPSGLPENRVVDLLIDLARALDAAHAKGVVHRDVKPENMLVDEGNDWSLKITDFGIARSDDQARLTKTGLVMGTAQYLSPEQAMGKQATSLSDIYALGIVAYEMLVGNRPFTGASQVEIAMAQVKKRPPELPEHINPDLRRVVMMALAKAPANRPRSAAAVARILEAIKREETPRFTSDSIPVTSGAGASGPGFADTHASGTSADPAQQDPADSAAGSESAGATAGGAHAEGTSADSAEGHSGAAPSAGTNGISPTGTKTAAMPLPVAGRSRHSRSTSRSGRSAPSVPSAPSEPSEHSPADPRTADSADTTLRTPGADPSSPMERRHPSERREHSASPELPRIGPIGLPLAAMLILTAIAIVVGFLWMAGVIPLGAAPANADTALLARTINQPAAVPGF